MGEDEAWEQTMVAHMYKDIINLLFSVNANLKIFIKQ